MLFTVGRLRRRQEAWCLEESSWTAPAFLPVHVKGLRIFHGNSLCQWAAREGKHPPRSGPANLSLLASARTLAIVSWYTHTSPFRCLPVTLERTGGKWGPRRPYSQKDLRDFSSTAYLCKNVNQGQNSRGERTVNLNGCYSWWRGHDADDEQQKSRWSWTSQTQSVAKAKVALLNATCSLWSIQFSFYFIGRLKLYSTGIFQ